MNSPRLGFLICSDGLPLINSNNHYQCAEAGKAMTEGVIRARLGSLPLMPGEYTVSLWFGNQHGDHQVAENALSFEVIEKDIWGNGKTPPKGASYMWWPTNFEIVN